MKENRNRRLCKRFLKGLFLILRNPEPEESGAVMLTDQPLLTASPATVLTRTNTLDDMLKAFPAPVLCPLQGSGLTLTGGTSYDAAFEGGVGRILELTYRTEDGKEIKLTSIYPARALALLPIQDYKLSREAGQTLAGLRSVRMERSGAIRLHAQGYEALYALETPPESTAWLVSLTRLLYLMEYE